MLNLIFNKTFMNYKTVITTNVMSSVDQEIENYPARGGLLDVPHCLFDVLDPQIVDRQIKVINLRYFHKFSQTTERKMLLLG